MSLLDEAMEDCVLLDKTRVPDGYGGYIPTWVESVPFKAAIVFNTSLDARVAAQQGVKNLYDVTVSKGMMLDFHDVFKRTRDGKVFRVTSDGDENQTPESASLDMRQVTAEEWSLANG